MPSKWQNVLKNLGEWQGSFTRLSPQGEILEDIPSVVILEGLNENQTIRQTIHRFPPQQPPQEQILEYSTLARSILVFENGAFSQGSMQWGPFSEFGAELGLIEGNSRLRLVQMYNKESHLASLTLIREHLAGTPPVERPPLTVEQLLGEWEGEAVTQYADLRPPEHYPTHLSIVRAGRDRLSQALSFGPGLIHTLRSTARIEGSSLQFDQSPLPLQILLLPDGVSSNSPHFIQGGQGFILEVGWLVNPQRRWRLVRQYTNKGEWISLTLVQEQKIS